MQRPAALAHLFLALLAAPAAHAQPLPAWAPTFRLNRSTYYYACKQDGPLDPLALRNWSTVNLDWSIEKDAWARDKPMTAEERLLAQAVALKAAGADHVWVYRNTAKALPFFVSVRDKLVDPRFASWFLRFANSTHGGPPYAGFSPKCDANYDPPLCSDFYHDSVCPPDYPWGCQVPAFPHSPTGNGDCAAPACDVGAVPIGEYLFDPRAWNVSAGGMTLGEWFVSEYLFGPLGGGNANVSGFYFDDSWGNNGCSEIEQHQLADMGLSPADVADIAAAYESNMAAVNVAVVARGAFTEQLQVTLDRVAGNATCAAVLRPLCGAASITQTRFTYLDVGDSGDGDTLPLSVAQFLLVRGPYAQLGHHWSGCACGCPLPEWPPLLDADVGEPTNFCSEPLPNVFVRNYTRANVSIDCATATPEISVLPWT